MTATAPFMSAAPSPWTAPSSLRPGRLSCAGTVSRWPARRTSGRSPRCVAPASTHVSPASRAPASRSTSSTSAARSDSFRDSDGTSMSSRARDARRSASAGTGRGLYAGVPPTTGADAHVARAYCRSASATPRRSGWSRSTATVPASPMPSDAQPLPTSSAHRSPLAASRALRVRRPRRAPGLWAALPLDQGVAGAAPPPGPGLELPRLLERVDAHLRVAADRQAHAGVAVAQRGEEAVAEVALGRGARDDDRAGLRQHVDVGVGDVDAVDDARPRAEEAAAQQQRDRRAAVFGGALVELAHLLVRVDVEHEVVLARVGADCFEPRRGHGAD